MSADRFLISDQNSIYFLTFTVVGWLDVFTRNEYKIEIVASLNYCINHKGLKVYSWCLMSNHLHLVAQAELGFRMSDIIRDFKKYTAKKIIHLIQEEPESRKGWMLNQFEYAGRNLQRIKYFKFWKDDSHAIQLEGDMIDQKIEYTHQNPVEALIVEEPEYYLYSSARDYAGRRGLVRVTFAS